MGEYGSQNPVLKIGANMNVKKLLFSTLVMYFFFAFLVFFNIWKPADLIEIAFGYLTAFAVISIGLFFVSQGEQSDDFELWLVENEAQINCGEGVYMGIPIFLKTEMVHYEACLSFFFLHAKLRSKPFVHGAVMKRRRWVVFSFNLLSLLLGWWRIPGGFRQTLGVVASNLKGGSSQTVQDVLKSFKRQPDDSTGFRG
jgi:hypothetical protein